MHARAVRAAPTCIETHARARTSVPRFVNQLPLPTLLLFYDALLIPLAAASPRPHRRARAAAAAVAAAAASKHGHWEPAATEMVTISAGATPPAAGGPSGSVGGGPSSAAHLQLALALLEGCRSEVLRLLAEGGGEAVGSAFDKILRHALSPLDAPTLLRAAARYDLEPHRLRFLRRTLSSHGGGSGEGEPTLGRVQRTRLRLLAGRRAEAPTAWPKRPGSQQPTRPTRCSRGPPAGAGLPAGPEGRALAAWMPQRGRSMACAPMLPAPRSPISLPSTLTLTQGAAASAIQGCLAAPRATAATGRAAPRASAAAARRVGHRPATGGGLRLHVHGARRIGRRVVRACARDGARARLTVVELECAVHLVITWACAHAPAPAPTHVRV